MKNVNLTVDQDTLLLICNSLSQLHKIEAFASEEHRRISLDIRYKLGPRLFRSALKVPCPQQVKLDYLEANLINFSLINYECNEQETPYARQILRQIQPKMLSHPPNPLQRGNMSQDPLSNRNKSLNSLSKGEYKSKSPFEGGRGMKQ